VGGQDGVPALPAGRAGRVACGAGNRLLSIRMEGETDRYLL